MKPKIIEYADDTRIPCICQVRTANMIYNGYVIGTISEERNDADEFDWEEWEKAGYPQMVGIDTNLRLDEYITTGYSSICRGENSPRYKRWIVGRIG